MVVVIYFCLMIHICFVPLENTFILHSLFNTYRCFLLAFFFFTLTYFFFSQTLSSSNFADLPEIHSSVNILFYEIFKKSNAIFVLLVFMIVMLCLSLHANC